MTYIETLGAKAKAAEHAVASASAKLKNEALKSIADALIENTSLIIEKNRLDLDNAVKNGMASIKRKTFIIKHFTRIAE